MSDKLQFVETIWAVSADETSDKLKFVGLRETF
jgi:hypothetical protein